MPTAPPSNVFLTEDDLRTFLSDLGVDARLDDKGTGTVSDKEAERLTRARYYGSAEVASYIAARYDLAKAETSWQVNGWAVVCAARWLCATRFGSVPDGLRELYEGSDGKGGVSAEMREVREWKRYITDIGLRNTDSPAYSNVYVDPRYRIRQIRVERPTSERTPTQYSQDPDWTSENTRE